MGLPGGYPYHSAESRKSGGPSCHPGNIRTSTAEAQARAAAGEEESTKEGLKCTCRMNSSKNSRCS